MEDKVSFVKLLKAEVTNKVVDVEQNLKDQVSQISLKQWPLFGSVCELPEFLHVLYIPISMSLGIT